MIPSIIYLRIHSAPKFRLRLWLPFFLLWPVILALFLVLLPFLLIAEIVLRLCGRPIRLFRMIGGIFCLLSSLRGTVVKVNNPKENSIVNVSIY